MSSSIPEPKLKTSARQDIRLISEIILICTRHSIPAFGLVLHLSSINDVLDGKPIDSDPMDFKERVRARSFGRYVDATTEFLLTTSLCTLDRHLIDTALRAPTPVNYVRVTKFGKIFVFLPYSAQWLVLNALRASIFSVAALKKYRWIFSIASMSVAAFTWARTHDLSVLAIALALTTGAAAAFLIAWLVRVLDISSDV